MFKVGNRVKNTDVNENFNVLDDIGTVLIISASDKTAFIKWDKFSFDGSNEWWADFEYLELVEV